MVPTGLTFERNGVRRNGVRNLCLKILAGGRGAAGASTRPGGSLSHSTEGGKELDAPCSAVPTLHSCPAFAAEAASAESSRLVGTGMA